MGTIIIGDIHGCFYSLLDLLEKINYNKQNDKLIFVGDYIDRGLHSFLVVDYLMKLQNEVGINQCICLKGNHEDMFLKDPDLWKYNKGSYETIYSYKLYNKPLNYHKKWLENLPLTYETEKYIVCHAGLPKIKISDNTEEDILWDREWLKNLCFCNEKQVIFGHTPSTGQYYITKNGNIGIDTGCVFGYTLTACIDDGSGIFTFEKVECNFKDKK